MALSVKDKGTRIIITGTTSTKQKVRTGPMLVTSILWRKPTAIGHKALFCDENGDFEFGFDEATVANQSMSDDWPFGHSVITDLYCDDLDSGTIIIYYKSHY